MGDSDFLNTEPLLRKETRIWKYGNNFLFTATACKSIILPYLLSQAVSIENKNQNNTK